MVGLPLLPERPGQLRQRVPQQMVRKVAVLPAGRGHDQERDIRFSDGVGIIHGRTQALVGRRDQLLQARFIDRCTAGVDRVHEGGVDVHPERPESTVCETGRGTGAELTQSNDGYVHLVPHSIRTCARMQWAFSTQRQTHGRSP